MALFGEFYVPAESFALYETLQAEPDLVVEIERVAATDEVITPYFLVNGCPPADFERAAERDRSVSNLRRVDDFEESTLYRANWVVNVESIVYAYTTLGSTILEASAQHDSWELRIRFTDRQALDLFQTYCEDRDIPFELTKLYEQAQPHGRGKYELTEKQHRSLVTAWEMGYYDSSDVTLTDVADELGVTHQALSKRLQRGHHNLIEHTLMVTPPDEP